MAVDATGFPTAHASAYYTHRATGAPPAWFDGGWAQCPQRRRWVKASAVADVATHLLLGLSATWGPTQDAPTLLPLLDATLATLPPGHTLGTVLADAAYDSEANRVGVRARGLPRPVIALNRGRYAHQLPRTPERRRAAQRFARRRYRQRAHVECVFSCIKRTLGATLAARRPQQQLLALWLRVLAHNIGLLLRAPRLCSTEPEPRRHGEQPDVKAFPGGLGALAVKASR